MKQARFIAETFSKDPSTKVGAVMVDSQDFTMLTHGYNGMPRGIDESRQERQERPLKYAYYEHAERNAIYNLARQVLKGSIAISTTKPSISCARALISVGVTEFYFPHPAERDEELQIALQLFSEARVLVGLTGEERLIFASDETLREESRHLRKIMQYANYAAALPELLTKEPLGSATVYLARDEYTVLAQGYSGMPRGAQDDRTERYLGELRDMWVESSVRNAIYNAVRPKLKGSTALVTATTCVECARACAAVGIAEVIYTEPTEDFKQRWEASISTALDMLRELGVTVTEMPQSLSHLAPQALADKDVKAA